MYALVAGRLAWQGLAFAPLPKLFNAVCWAAQAVVPDLKVVPASGVDPTAGRLELAPLPGPVALAAGVQRALVLAVRPIVHAVVDVVGPVAGHFDAVHRAAFRLRVRVAGVIAGASRWCDDRRATAAVIANDTGERPAAGPRLGRQRGHRAVPRAADRV